MAVLVLDDLKALNKVQRSVFTASLLGWTLDAFDYFLLTFVIKDVAAEFHVKIPAVAFAVTLTLIARPFGALAFGWLADRFGRRPVLMIDVLLYAALELASAFAPSLIIFLALRLAFGFAMGGEWGIGASLALESIPVKSRGVISGLLQEGYAMGQLLGALVFWFVYPHLSHLIPHMPAWRIMFVIGVLPAFLVFYIRRHVPESPIWEQTRDARKAAGVKLGLSVFTSLGKHWKMVIYAILLMTAFNFFSHGTQDVYATFLTVQHKFSPPMVGMLTAIMNCGAILGGLTFGMWSEKIGRRRAIAFAALLALPIIPLWAFAVTPLLLGLGGFLLQIAVQGAWGIVPVHLNELSPQDARGTFPGAAYQFGNLLASGNLVFQTKFAESHHNNYGLALALVAGTTAIVLAGLAFFGPDAKGKTFAASDA
jgi:SHS family lactate transporter-like MFS transporter